MISSDGGATEKKEPHTLLRKYLVNRLDKLIKVHTIEVNPVRWEVDNQLLEVTLLIDCNKLVSPALLMHY